MPDQKTVFIAAHDPQFLQQITKRCAGLGLDVHSASDGMDALWQILNGQFGLLILDCDMPGTDWFDLAEKLKIKSSQKPVSQPIPKPIPIVALGQDSEQDHEERWAALNAYYCHKGLDTWANLRSIISKEFDLQTPGSCIIDTVPVLETAPVRPPKILVVDDDLRITAVMKYRLEAFGLTVFRAKDATEGAAMAVKELPDLIITDYNMPGGSSGENMVFTLKRIETTKNIPVIVVTGQNMDGRTDFVLRREMLGRGGAQAYLEKPYDFDQLVAEIRKLIRIPEKTDAPVAPQSKASTQKEAHGSPATLLAVGN